MGLWSSTFGGGNSFSQSVANVTTPNDGTSYSGGSLANDSNGSAADASNAVVGNDGSVFDGVFGGNDNYSVQSGDSLSAIAARNGTTVEALMAANPGITNANNIQAGQNINIPGGSSGGVKGAAPSGIKNLLGYTNTVGIVGKLAGWANGLNPKEDATTVVDGRQVYTSADGMQYSYNFLGMPYEVQVQDGQVVDALSIKDPVTGLTGYEQKAQEARANGDNETADAIMQEAEDNAQEADGAAGSGSRLSSEAISQMIIDSGVAQSSQEIQEMVADPKAFLDARGINLSDVIPNLDPETAGTLLDPNNPNYMLSDLGQYNPEIVTGVNPVATPTAVNPMDYTAATMGDRMNNPQFNVDAASGEIRDQNLVNAENYTLDQQGSATGINADGTTNFTGQALNDYASQGMSQVIDTRTVAGKLMAQSLGEGNYTDAKATVTGQLEILADAFVDQNGNPKIPAFAQAQAREVSRTITFKGMTGSAATAATAAALMEASLPIAQQEAQFFQTLTVKNLDNKQQSIINKATVLSKFDLANLDARETAAVQNAQAFLEVDMTNLSNEQQAEVINTQARVQALLEDTQQANVQRRFTAETTNQFTQFYDELGVQVEQFNANLISDIKRFNAGEINDATEFSQTLENQRQQFYAKMQYAVDESNARWRQTVATTNTQMAYDAAAIDVKNYLDISQEGLNRLWDRTDSALDYLYKSAALEEEFEVRLLLGEMQAAAATPQKSSLFDTLLGGAIKIGAAWAGASDVRLKENIQHYDTLNGVKFYTWDWNDTAKEIGYDHYPTMGVIAQEVQQTHPDTVIEGPEGYLMVNYGKLKDEI